MKTIEWKSLDEKADTFVHEIEIGDIDGDGKLEFLQRLLIATKQVPLKAG